LFNTQCMFINTSRVFIRQVLTAQFPAEQDLTKASRITAQRKKKDSFLQTSASLLFNPSATTKALPSQYTETLRNWNKISDIPEKLQNTPISSVRNDGLLWTAVTHIPKNKSEIFLPPSHRKTGLEGGGKGKASLTVLESNAVWSTLTRQSVK